MSRLTELISKIKSKDSQLGVDLEREFKALSSRREFGLNFERHSPEVVELPNRPIRKGDKVRVLPKRGSKAKGDPQLWLVKQINKNKAKQFAVLETIGKKETEKIEVSIEDLVVVAEFHDYIYPGLVSTGKVERGNDKPFHTVINGENYHALKALSFTHKGKIDVIYIDPPYNTGARDWKYNNDYVETEDLYRHSKWLAFMERRLELAKELLNPNNSVLVVTIDEKEFLRLGMLLEQLFQGQTIQMVTIVQNSQGSSRKIEASRVDEYAFFVYFGSAKIHSTEIQTLPSEDKQSQVGQERIWYSLIRGGKSALRSNKKMTSSFFAVLVDNDGIIKGIEEPLPPEQNPEDLPPHPDGYIRVFPKQNNGKYSVWQCSKDEFKVRLKAGHITTGSSKNGARSILYIREGTVSKIESGELEISGRDHNNAFILNNLKRTYKPKSVWYVKSHNAGTHGSMLLEKLIGRTFPFPKSLYAVEDTLRMILKEKREGIVLDFFAGSGTTAHALMRLNKQDNGNRQCISITNNEVSADEQKALKEKGLRPGDESWEKWGICDHITKPRVMAAISGKTPAGKSIEGDYNFTDVFPMSDGFNENAEFFTLTYETPIAVSYNLAFERIAPLLWMRAGSKGKRIGKIPKSGWELADNYGVLIDLDKTSQFCKALCSQKEVKLVYIVTNDDRRFQSIAKQLSRSIEPVRLYESYLKNFQFTNEL
jgi:adenine-specific DNA-methyltransferase